MLFPLLRRLVDKIPVDIGILTRLKFCVRLLYTVQCFAEKPVLPLNKLQVILHCDCPKSLA